MKVLTATLIGALIIVSKYKPLIDVIGTILIGIIFGVNFIKNIPEEYVNRYQLLTLVVLHIIIGGIIDLILYYSCKPHNVIYIIPPIMMCIPFIIYWKYSCGNTNEQTVDDATTTSNEINIREK